MTRRFRPAWLTPSRLFVAIALVAVAGCSQSPDEDSAAEGLSPSAKTARGVEAMALGGDPMASWIELCEVVHRHNGQDGSACRPERIEAARSEPQGTWVEALGRKPWVSELVACLRDEQDTVSLRTLFALAPEVEPRLVGVIPTGGGAPRFGCRSADLERLHRVREALIGYFQAVTSDPRPAHEFLIEVGQATGQAADGPPTPASLESLTPPSTAHIAWFTPQDAKRIAQLQDWLPGERPLSDQLGHIDRNHPTLVGTSQRHAQAFRRLHTSLQDFFPR